MFIFDITQPLTLILLLAATVLLVFLGKEIKKPSVVALTLVFFLVLVAVHAIQLGNIPQANYETYHSTLLGCLTIDLIMVFLTFFSYLWIDDIAAKFYKKKSIDNSLDWFWKQI